MPAYFRSSRIIPPDLTGGPDLMNHEVASGIRVWLMKSEVAATDTSEDGQPVGLSLAMELRDVNDSDVTIEPPEDGE